MKRLLALRYRLSTQLYLGVGGGVALTIAASLVGWFSFAIVGAAQDRINRGSVPDLEAAFAVANSGGALVAAARNLAATSTREEFATVDGLIEKDRLAFVDQLSTLAQREAVQDRFDRIRVLSETLLSNIDEIKDGKSALLDLDHGSQNLRTQLTELRSSLDGVLIPAIDDQLFYTTTGYRELGRPPSPRFEHLSERELAQYRYLAELQADASIATQLLATAFTVPNAASVEPLRERFEAADSRIARNLSSLEGTELHDNIAPLFAQLSRLGLDEGSGFDLLGGALRLTAQQQDLLARNLDIAIALDNETEGLVDAANTSVQEATQASTQAIVTARSLLIAISVISVGGAVLIAWLYIGRVLLRRLQRLSDRMRQMADGDIEAEVEVVGQDEVGNMAAALEVFRRHALEVQRLNLVETLASELQGKNEQLERVLVDLQQAQDQIVMREKLAALGELTAGVAHEIRNPLNFIKNFSEASDDLIDELREVLAEGGDQLSKEQQENIKDISRDLQENLERIVSHGNRANRIVNDMLQMGRDSTESQVVEINTLLDEHARLAYHSARATDPNFQLHIVQEFDPNAGQIEVVPQELGRVFLNMVGNACDATDEKRRALAGSADYLPTVWLSTRRGQDQLEVRIRDNGQGMPPEIVEKIFNPFFTTKPTNRGTGLGLAISSDIIRKHGGSIQVQSEPGQFTEMTIGLPLDGIPAGEQEESAP